MKAHIFLKDGDQEKFLVEVQNLEVVPRGLYVVDNQVYEYTGQPTFIIEKNHDLRGSPHMLTRVKITVKKYEPPSDLLG